MKQTLLNSSNRFKIVAFLGMIAVILGAFGSHGLKPKLSITAYSAYQTGIQYHFYHTLVLLAITVFLHEHQNKWFVKSFYFFLAGICLFSGSLYLLSIKDLLELSFLKFAGPLTPIGGILLIVGWGFIWKGATTFKK